MKKFRNIFVFLFIASLILQPVYAVLKEANLSQTLKVLKSELEKDAKRHEEIKAANKSRREKQEIKLVDYMKRCEQIGLMLYSQNSDFTFDVAFACQQATDLYKEFNETKIPYDMIKQRLTTDVERYDSLISVLEALPPSINEQS